MIARRALVWLALLAGPVALVLVCARLALARPIVVWFPTLRRPPATAAPRRNAQGEVEIRPTPSPVPTRALLIQSAGS